LCLGTGIVFSFREQMERSMPVVSSLLPLFTKPLPYTQLGMASWQERTIEVYRREEAVLALDRTLEETDVLQSSLLPGFSCRVGQLFTDR
jgi:hypothetical protein